MPNLVTRLAIREYDRDVEGMGSCVVVNFDKLTVAQAGDLRNRLREQGLRLKVVKNRLIQRVLTERGFEMPRLRGKCGIVFAPEERAITGAKIVRDFGKANRECSLTFVAGVIEEEVLSGDVAKTIPDLPDKDTVRSQLVAAIQGPARMLAASLAAVPGGLARCLKAKHEES